MTRSQTTTRLSALEVLGAPSTGPTVIQLDGSDAVMLAATGAGEVQLWTGEGVTTCAADTLVEPVTDPVHTEAVLRQAIAALNTLRQRALKMTTTLAEQQAVTLAAIRDYAIEAHRDGDICEDGLNQFLRTFDLGEYDPHVTIAYTIAGSFTILGANAETVRQAVLLALAVNFAAVRWVRDGSTQHQATIESVRPAQLSDGRPRFECAFVITGEYEVDSTDTDEAESDCRYNLRPSLAGLAGVSPGSVRCTVRDVDSELGY